MQHIDRQRAIQLIRSARAAGIRTVKVLPTIPMWLAVYAGVATLFLASTVATRERHDWEY